MKEYNNSKGDKTKSANKPYQKSKSIKPSYDIQKNHFTNTESDEIVSIKIAEKIDTREENY